MSDANARPHASAAATPQPEAQITTSAPERFTLTLEEVPQTAYAAIQQVLDQHGYDLHDEPTAAKLPAAGQNWLASLPLWDYCPDWCIDVTAPARREAAESDEHEPDHCSRSYSPDGEVFARLVLKDVHGRPPEAMRNLVGPLVQVAVGDEEPAFAILPGHARSLARMLERLADVAERLVRP